MNNTVKVLSLKVLLSSFPKYFSDFTLTGLHYEERLRDTFGAALRMKGKIAEIRREKRNKNVHYQIIMKKFVKYSELGMKYFISK